MNAFAKFDESSSQIAKNFKHEDQKVAVKVQNNSGKLNYKPIVVPRQLDTSKFLKNIQDSIRSINISRKDLKEVMLKSEDAQCIQILNKDRRMLQFEMQANILQNDEATTRVDEFEYAANQECAESL